MLICCARALDVVAGCHESPQRQQTHEMWSDLQVLVRTVNTLECFLQFLQTNGCGASTFPRNVLHTHRVADIFAQMNNKLGGDIEKIRTTGRYFVEIWKAIGMEGIGEKVPEVVVTFTHSSWANHHVQG